MRMEGVKPHQTRILNGPMWMSDWILRGTISLTIDGRSYAWVR